MHLSNRFLQLKGLLSREKKEEERFKGMEFSMYDSLNDEKKNGLKQIFQCRLTLVI